MMKHHDDNKMRIAFVLSVFPAFTETFILSQIIGLVEQGHRVDIWANRAGSPDLVHEEVKAYNLDRRTRYFRKPETTKFSRRLSLLGNVLACLVRSPWRTGRVLAEMMRQPGGFSYPYFYEAVPFLMNRYDVIHCHFGMRGAIGLRARQFGLCRRLVVTFYGYDISGYVKEMGPDVYRDLFDQADRLLVLSRYMKDTLLRLGAPESKVVIHHLGVSPDDFPFRKRQPAPGEPVRLLTVARLTEKKGLEYSIRAVAAVLQRRPSLQVEYQIVGDGPLKQELEILIRDLGLSNTVCLCGPKLQQEVRRDMSRADLFILASVTGQSGDQEGTPTALIEAICSGLPVLSTWHAGIPEVIVDNESGFLVPERDSEALAEKLIELLDHPDRWEEMGCRGRRHFDEQFDIHMLNRKLESLYRQLMQADH